MIAASWPRSQRTSARLLRIDRASGAIEHHGADELPLLLRRGDLLVVNDAATLPASLAGSAEGVPIELRLMDEEAGVWRAVVFGAGSWRTPTERRPPPPALAPGARLSFGGLSARVEAVLAPSARLLSVRFEQSDATFWTELYRVGKPVQYSYLSGDLRLWHVQNAYAARPWAVEAPSAGFVLNADSLGRARQRGVEIAALTHAAGLSSTGDETLDAALPLRERFEIPASTVAAVAHARARGGRIIAVGTSVVRALETRALEHGSLRPGPGRSELRIGPGFELRVVDGLLSGMHDPTVSHYALLQAFASRAHLDAAHSAAVKAGYLEHEFGDVCLLL
ncbi:MAG TPA: S-adenosylmethionine:tRNA ribosyltransferase-isomerase [Polyangiaceae bacterium]|nr:S-adenosylmethionine:tRNA ribosyltransferase-isomerase [Polyangiaceae bacterium]